MGKKSYAIVTCKWDGKVYAAHIDDFARCIHPDFSSVDVVSKAEYRQARNAGMPSWGEAKARMALGGGSESYRRADAD